MKKKWIAVAAVFIILLAFSIPLIVKGCNNADNTSSTESHAVKVVSADLRTTISASGKISMPHQAKLYFAIGGNVGNVSQVNVEFGDVVKKGDVLARLNTTALNRTVALAEYDVRLARLALDASGPEVWDANRILLDKALIVLDETKAQLAGANITAPFNGVITQVNVVVGDYITASTPIFVIVDTSQVEAIAMVDEVDVDKVAAGQRAMITIDAVPGAVINGSVKAVSSQATSEAGAVTYKTSVEVNTSSGVTLRDGMTARVDIVVANKNAVLVVPNAAITRNGSNRVVKVALDGGKTEERVVTIGMSNSTYTEIVSGLKLGESVMVTGK